MARFRTIEENVHYLSELVAAIGRPEDEKLWEEYSTDGKSGIVCYIESQLNGLLENIQVGRITIKNFQAEDAEKLCKVLECESINRELCNKIYHQIHSQWNLCCDFCYSRGEKGAWIARSHFSRRRRCPAAPHCSARPQTPPIPRRR